MNTFQMFMGTWSSGKWYPAYSDLTCDYISLLEQVHTSPGAMFPYPIKLFAYNANVPMLKGNTSPWNDIHYC